MNTRRCTRERDARLGDEQRLRLVRNRRCISRGDDHLAGAAFSSCASGLRSNAEPGIRTSIVRSSRFRSDQAIFAHAEECEIVRRSAIPETASLPAASSPGSGGGLALEFGDHFADAGQHRPPVRAPRRVRRRATARDPERSRCAAIIVVDAIDMDMDEAFAQRSRLAGSSVTTPSSAPDASRVDREDRMHDQPDRRDVVFGERRHHRIDQERHVVVDDLDDRDRL